MTNRALLVGINEFRERLATGEVVERPEWRLRGCLNDVRRFENLLVKHFEFPESEIRRLENEAATREGILDGLTWLLRDAEPEGGDVRCFYVSSHGTFVDDDGRDRDDADFGGKDEVLVPHVHDWNDPFRDDELCAIFEKIPANVNFTFIADCCHGGTMQEEVTGLGGGRFTRERKIEPPAEIFSRVYAAADRALGRPRAPGLEKTAGAARPKKRFGSRIVDRHALLAACRADETAAESVYGSARGAFSWAIEKAIRKQKGKLTYGELIDRAGILLEFEGQEPQLECPEDWKNRSFLAPLGSVAVYENSPEEKESKMSSKLVKFLARMGKQDKLMGRKQMKKSLEKSGLSDQEIEVLKSGDADRIEAWLASLYGGDGDKPLTQQGAGG